MFKRDVYENPMEEWNERTVALLGEEGVKRLADARVLIVGVGGVGGYAVEMLARSGVGRLALVDADCVAPSNINRQIIALQSTVDCPKTELFRRRIADINPACRVQVRTEFLDAGGAEELLDSDNFDLVVDAIDTVAPKVALIAACMRRNLPILSSMGAGGRSDASKVMVTDLWLTREDGLARAVRQRLKKMGLRRPLKVVASSEAPKPNALLHVDSRNKLTSFGTIAMVPSVFGILLASEAVKTLLRK